MPGLASRSSTCVAPRSSPASCCRHERYPQEGSLRGGHIPGARNVPWARAVNEDGTFKSTEELIALYQDELGLEPTDDIVAYCRIGERSSLTWFVLTYLLGFSHVRNYDGSWTEWGNLVPCAHRQRGLRTDPERVEPRIRCRPHLTRSSPN